MSKFVFEKRLPQGSTAFKEMFYSTRLILEAAESLGCTWETIPGTEIMKVSWQGQDQYFHRQVPPQTSNLGMHACHHKQTTRRLLKKAGISVVDAFMLSRKTSAETRQEIFDTLNKPLVIKPNSGTHGTGVHLNVSDSATYNQILDELLDTDDPKRRISVEEMFDAKNEYRILATRDRVVGVINRIPANVIGDGQHTIKELIAEKNADPRRAAGHARALVKLKVDRQVKANLAEQDLTLDTIPDKDQQIFLRKNSNLSTGGDSFDVTDHIHPSVKELALKTIRAIPGLGLGGIDFMTKDITAEQPPDSYIVIEVNSSPMLSMHDHPYQGTSRGAAREFVYLLFPDLRPST